MGYIADLSEHNTVTDWAKAAKELDAAILRIGYRGSIEGKPAYKKITEDAKFRSHLAGCRKYKIPYTVYYFPTPLTDEEAVEETIWLIDKVQALELCMPVFIDSENVKEDRTGRADKLSKSTRTHLLRVITDRLLAEGIPCGVYSYTNWLKNNVDMSKLDPLVIQNTWVAQPGTLKYTGEVSLWQYGKKKFSWTTAEVDVNKIVANFALSTRKEAKTMGYYRKTAVDMAKSFVGVVTGSARHKQIIDTYNAHTPRARGVKMSYTMPWCATFVSYIAIVCGYTKIIPLECSCGYMVELAKKMGIWQEKDSYVPKPGDIIMYDWDDDDKNKGDCVGWPDHTGFAETVGKNSFTTIEGNSGNGAGIVKRQTVIVNQAKIRGFICPKYTADAPPTTKKVAITINLPEIHLGDKGEHVKLWQFLIGIDQTGIYDEAAMAATKTWQKKNGKKVDGWIGNGCWTKAMQLKGWI